MHLREGKSIPEAAEAIGVNKVTVYRWLERDAEFRRGADDARIQLRGRAAGVVARRMEALAEKAMDRFEELLGPGWEDLTPAAAARVLHDYITWAEKGEDNIKTTKTLNITQNIDWPMPPGEADVPIETTAEPVDDDA